MKKLSLQGTQEEWEKELAHKLYQYDNRMDLDEKEAKKYWQQDWVLFIQGIVKKAEEKRTREIKRYLETIVYETSVPKMTKEQREAHIDEVMDFRRKISEYLAHYLKTEEEK